MAARQSFNDFLNSGPSTPRGRGRGGGRGGRGGGGGRGGSQWTPGGGSKATFNADYTHMPFNYDSINKQKYTKMDGFNVQPFGNTNSPGPSEPFTPRGRGRGKGGYTPGGSRNEKYASKRGGGGGGGSYLTPRSGTATPVHGLGFHEESHHNAYSPRGGRYTSTVGKGIGTGEITWGGGMAPLFVKAGELFKDGEVDIITMDKDHHIHVEALPMSDPSAPQMTNLRDETEIDLIDLGQDSSAEESDKQELETEEDGSQDETIQIEEDAVSTNIEFEEELIIDQVSFAEVVEVTQITKEANVNQISPSPTPANEESTVLEAGSEEEISADPEPSIIGEEQLVDDAPLFYIDTEPSTSNEVAAPTYETVFAPPLGARQARPPSPEEEVVFVPKAYRQPEPIFVQVASSSHRSPFPPSPQMVSRAFVNPRALSRAEKKAAKRDKRRGKRGGKDRKYQAAIPRDDSDIEWGSDGPPPVVLDVQGAVAIDHVQETENERILRDYMAGTKLNAQLEDEESEAVETDEEVDLEAMRRFGSGVKGLQENGEMVIDDEDEEWSDDSDQPQSRQVRGSDDDDDDDDDTSDLGDLEGILDIDSEDDEEIEKEIEEMFSGKSQWKNETDWFINTLESALDGGAVDMKDRKSRNKVFKSIENGDFGDDWGLEPVKKNNKKNKHVPAELEAQWEADRLRKAEKKQQRELERLIEEIDISRSSRKGKGKGKGKSTNLIQQASMAHLIPASASKIAEMFDIDSSDDDFEATTAMFRKGGRLPTSFSLIQVDEKIQLFLNEREKNSLALPPMDKEGRKRVHLLAECYGLKSKSRGGGKTRFTVLIKTKHSGRQVDYKKIERLLTASQSSNSGGFYNRKGSGNPNKFNSSKSNRSGGGGGGGSGPSARAREGELVGEGAEKIGMDNVGHKLLSKMGWAEGDRIGRLDGGGLENPIIAIVKNTKAGLGA